MTSLAVHSLFIIASPAHAGQRSRKAFVRAETAHLRSGPGQSHKTKGLLDAGRKAKVVGRKDGWVQVRLESGTEGWIREDLLKVSKRRTRDHDSDSDESQSRSRRLAQQRRKKAEKAHEEKVAAEKAAARRRKAQIAQAAAEKKERQEAAAAKAARVARAKKVAQLAAAKQAKEAKAAAAARARRQAALAAAAQPGAVRVPVTAPMRRASVTAAASVPVKAPSLASSAVLALPRTSGAEHAAPSVDDTPQVIPARAPSAADPRGITRTVLPAEEPVAPEEHPSADPDDTSAQAALTEAIRVALARESAAQGDGIVKIADTGINRSSTRADRLIRRAMSYRGTPYRMGATGRGAFDCSGFTKFLYKSEGETLPRTAAEQYRKGLPVAKTDLKAGDLVFFKNTYKRGVSHVGIFVGSGKFIHASSRGGVRIDSLSGAYYTNHWAGARRPR